MGHFIHHLQRGRTKFFISRYLTGRHRITTTGVAPDVDGVHRFSDGKEKGYKDLRGRIVKKGATTLYTAEDNGNATESETDKKAWLDAGRRFVGGTLAGLQSKLGYLKRLGVTAIWIGPVFKQVAALGTYHGYGVQNFLDVEPRFGTREQLRHLVQSAHEIGIYVILDIILNHSGDVFAYEADAPTYNGSVFPVKGFWDENRKPTIPMTDGPIDEKKHPSAFPDAAIWPAELQSQSTFDRKGKIGSDQWDTAPDFLEGDFFSLKDIQLGPPAADDNFAPTAALEVLCEVYKFWISYLDIDGYRLDTVKHMGDGPTRYFATTVHEFAQCCGKHNFYLIGEIAGDRTFQTMEVTGLDAALGIGRVQQTLWQLPKGQCDPNEYFGLFRNAKFLNKGSHAWLKDKIVTMIDDHDQIWRGDDKARFCAFEDAAIAPRLSLAAMALNICTLGIPCIYYGTEQAFDGSGASDRFIREAMFGGAYGAFRSKDHHFFDESSFAYVEFAKICAIRKKEETLRRGRQYLREISCDGSGWGVPMIEGQQMKSIVPWSRIFNGTEILCAINTDTTSATTAYVTVDHWLTPSGSSMNLLYTSVNTSLAKRLTAENDAGRSVVKLTIPPAGFVMYR